MEETTKILENVIHIIRAVALFAVLMENGVICRVKNIINVEKIFVKNFIIMNAMTNANVLKLRAKRPTNVVRMRIAGKTLA